MICLPKVRVIFNLSCIFLFLAFALSLVSAATLITTDSLGNTQIEFSPDQVVYFQGTGFSPTSILTLELHLPDNSVQTFSFLSNSQGSFVYPYALSGMVGYYYAYVTDGVVSAQTIFDDPIFTVKSDCGNVSQNVNNFSVGETVYIQGVGVPLGNTSWSITGQPGGASCDPNIAVASGFYNVTGNGNFCFAAYTIQSNDCGVYRALFSNNLRDNYHVDANFCSNASACGTPTSSLICLTNNVFNETITPSCLNGNCTLNTTQVFVQSCGIANSSIICVGNNLTQMNTTPSCASGTCLNNFSFSIIQTCALGCSQSACVIGNQTNQTVCGNNITEQGEQCDDGNQNNFDNCRNTCVFPFCGDNIVDSGEECDDGNTNDGDGCNEICLSECLIDADFDEVCDPDDVCLNSTQGEPVDQNGCDIFQFCNVLSCGPSCASADWMDNEQDVANPFDCAVVIIHRGGLLQQPRCVPLTFNEMCAG